MRNHFEGPGRYPPGSFFTVGVILVLGSVVHLGFQIKAGETIWPSLAGIAVGLIMAYLAHRYMKSRP